MIRVYGVEKGNSSWPRVTSGVRRGVRMLGQYAGFFDVAHVDAEYDDDSLGRGYDARVGLCVGPPPAASVMVGRGHHRDRLLMVATNSDWLPAAMMERAAKMVTAFVGTSHWASSVIENYAHGRPVLTYQHGVEPGFRPPQTLPEKVAPFAVLHLASTHMQRKGTRELIFGWAQAKRNKSLPVEAQLTLVVDGPAGYFSDAINEACVDADEIAASIIAEPRLDLAVEQMAELYCRHHFVCQPSRAEGFGLVPLEARACGVPVIATACSGHADHLNTNQLGVIIVPHGEQASVDDGPGAKAPVVSPDAVAACLGRAYRYRDQLAVEAQAGCEEFSRRWSWSSVTANFLVDHGEQLGLVGS